MIGSLEWRWPPHEVERSKYNIVNNYRQLVDWIADDRIIVDPLRTHTASPGGLPGDLHRFDYEAW